ncbi:MAG: hypothetical protein M4579_001188 [Chaenotheca gracillima]|nr:MAG: hypothetical protein M4579_001188 [Chaenotheca gracillima]
MSLLQGWLPPSREHWEVIVKVTGIQYVTDFYPAGKNSVNSRFNIPGKIGWATMESPGFLIVLYSMFTLPEQAGVSSGLPRANWLMAALYTIHYINRALISPYLNPSMSPMHPIVWVSAFAWQVMNGLSIGGWLGGWGPTKQEDWQGHTLWIQGGLMLWALGWLGNMWHDDELREIRRASARRQKKEQEKKDQQGKASTHVDKVYDIPQNGLFAFVFFPHYLLEWVEWAGFWMIGGFRCLPAQNFLINEISTMLPRALQGKRWYVEKFGAKRVGNRKAVIPGLL